MGLVDIPTELRIVIFDLVLSMSRPIYIYQELGATGVDAFIAKKPPWWLALLATSRALHDEAAAVLFGANHFHIMDAAGRQSNVLLHFLDTIGPENAARLKHMRISFPPAVTVSGGSRPVAVSNQGRITMSLLRSRCCSLATLEVLLQRTTFRDIMHSNQALIQEALSLAQMEFAAISWLSKIIVRLYWATSLETVEYMKKLGWVIVGRL